MRQTTRKHAMFRLGRPLPMGAASRRSVQNPSQDIDRSRCMDRLADEASKASPALPRRGDAGDGESGLFKKAAFLCRHRHLTSRGRRESADGSAGASPVPIPILRSDSRPLIGDTRRIARSPRSKGLDIAAHSPISRSMSQDACVRDAAHRLRLVSIVSCYHRSHRVLASICVLARSSGMGSDACLDFERDPSSSKPVNRHREGRSDKESVMRTR